MNPFPKILKLLGSDVDGDLAVGQLHANVADFLKDEGCGIINLVGHLEVALDQLLHDLRVSKVPKLLDQLCFGYWRLGR